MITAAFPKHQAPTLMRYADDFIVLHPDLTTIERIQKLIVTWLSEWGLELKPSKTRITHTLHEHQGHLGFDFLGFHVRQYLVGKRHTSRSTRGALLGFKTFIQPCPEAIHRHYEAIRDVIDRHVAAPQAVLIEHLNPLLRGWANYYSAVVSKRTFNKLDNLLFSKLLHWAYRRHPRRSRRWIIRKYWHLETGHWVFGTPDGGRRLYTHSQVPIRRHVKVRDTKSPFDGDWLYWVTRMGRHPSYPHVTPACSIARGVNVAGAGCTLKTETALNSITSSRNHTEAGKDMKTGNCCMDTATIKRPSETNPLRLKVLLTRAIRLRSRMI